MAIKDIHVGALLKRTVKEIGGDKVPVYAAQMAYALFFSLFPLLIFAAALLSLVADRPQIVQWIGGNVGRALPPDVADLLLVTIRKVLDAKGAPGLLSFGILTTAWSGSAVFGALRDALNAAYDVEETRPWWLRYLMQLAALAISGVVLLAATIILVRGETVVQWIAHLLHMDSAARITWTVIQFPLAIGGVVLVLWLLYYFLPNCKHQGKAYLFIGATVTTVLWLAATMLFRLYVQRFHAVNPAYGAIGAILVLLTWMYYSMFVLLVGGELNAELQATRARNGTPTTQKARTQHEDAAGSVEAVQGANGRSGARTIALLPAGPRRTFAPQELSARGLLSFLEDLADDAVTLVRRESALLRIEIAHAAKGLGFGTLWTATGAIFGLLGAFSVVAAIVLLPGDQWLPRDRYWLSAAIVCLLTGAFCYFALTRARTALRDRGR